MAAMAIFGLIMTIIFNQQLENRLQISPLSISVKQELLAQKTKLADIKTTDKLAQQIVRESFITGYKNILWIAVALALLSSLTAGFFITKKELDLKK